MILDDATVEAAVLETAGRIIRRGLGYDAPTSPWSPTITADHLGSDGIGRPPMT